MKRLWFTLLLLPLFLAQCDMPFVKEHGNGNVKVVTHTIQDFTTLKLKGNYQVQLIPGDAPALEIETDENLHEYIRVANEGSTLVLDTEEIIASESGIYVRLTYVSLEEIDVRGATELENEGTLEGDHLRVDMSGAGSIALRLALDDLELTISGAGSVELSGTTNAVRYVLSGAGSLEAYGLTARNCNIVVSGVGGAQVFASEQLQATVSGVGGIKYRGQPSQVTTDVNGIGSISED